MKTLMLASEFLESSIVHDRTESLRFRSNGRSTESVKRNRSTEVGIGLVGRHVQNKKKKKGGVTRKRERYANGINAVDGGLGVQVRRLS